MTRVSLAFAFGLAIGCGSPTNNDNDPGHDAGSCNPGSDECGPGYECNDEGVCVVDGTWMPPDANCPSVTFAPEPVNPSILLVLDRSASMNDPIAPGGPSRYVAMREALTGPSGVVTGLAASVYFGSSIYGCPSSTFQNTVVDRARDNATAIDTSIASFLNGQGQIPTSYTPTPLALDAAVVAFAADPPPSDSPPVIVLATDGLPNVCGGSVNDHTASMAASIVSASAAYDAGIPVYVLAINATAPHFQELANAGQGWQPGDPDVPYYPVANAADLQQAFQTIINGVLSCDLSLTSNINAGQAENGTVVVNGATLGYGTDWTLVDNNIIRLSPAACTDLRSTPTPTVSVEFPCGSVIL